MFDLLDTSAVIALRLPRLWWEALGGNPFGPRESHAMVTEKVASFHESVFAMQMELVKGALAVGGAVARLEPVGAVSMAAARDVMHAGMDPAARRVRSNVHRLSAE